MNRDLIADKAMLWGRVVLDLFYPRYCEICCVRIGHERSGYLCITCEEKIPFISLYRHCMRCAKPIVGSLAICSECNRKSISVDRCYAVSVYDGVIKECIQKLKYSKALHLADTIGQIFRSSTKDMIDPDNYDCLVPVPLHPRKYRERGFNQASLLAYSMRSPRPVKQLLRRVRYSDGQTLKDRIEREKSVKKSFTVKKGCEERILLVDDVYTTGATVNACSDVLKRAGALSVDVVVLARSV